MNKIILSIMVFGLIGCATSPVSPDKAKIVPKDRLFAYQDIISDGAQLTVVRDSGYLGSGCYSGFYLSGKRVASLDVGERADFYIPPGEWILGIKGEGAVCLSDGYLTEKKISIKSKQHKAVRIYSNISGVVDIKSISIN